VGPGISFIFSNEPTKLPLEFLITSTSGSVAAIFSPLFLSEKNKSFTRLKELYTLDGFSQKMFLVGAKRYEKIFIKCLILAKNRHVLLTFVLIYANIDG